MKNRESTIKTTATLCNRAEVQTFIVSPAGYEGNAPVYIPNLKLFHTGADSTGKFDTAAGTIQLHDPNFFYDNSLAGGAEAGAGTAIWAVPGAKSSRSDGKFTIADNWRAVSAPLLLPKKVDAVALNRNTDTNAVLYYDANETVGNVAGNAAHVRPLITFAPLYVENDPGTPASVENSGNEAIAPAAVTFQTQYSNWDNPYRVQVFRAPDATADPLAQSTLTYYEYDRQPAKLCNSKPRPEHADGGNRSGRGADYRPGDGRVDRAGNHAVQQRGLFAYAVDPRAGAVNFAFPWSVLCHDSSNKNVPVPQRYSPMEINAQITGLRCSVTSCWALCPRRRGALPPSR